MESRSRRRRGMPPERKGPTPAATGRRPGRRPGSGDGESSAGAVPGAVAPGSARPRRRRRPDRDRHPVRSHQQRAVTAHAEGPRRHRLEAGGRCTGAPVDAAPLPRRPRGPDEQRPSGPEEIEGGAVTGCRRQPGCRTRPPRSTLSSSTTGRGCRPDRRADHVVLRHDPALGLVRVEQLRVGPPGNTHAELPAEVEAALERGVHPGAAPWRHTVRSVTHEEGSAETEALGHWPGEWNGPMRSMTGSRSRCRAARIASVSRPVELARIARPQTAAGP